PTESRVNDRQIKHARRGGLGQVLGPVRGGGPFVSAVDGIISDVPRAIDIEAAENTGPAGGCVGSPPPFAAADKRHSVSGVGFEKINDLMREVGRETVGEEAPDHQNGFAIVMEITWVLSEVQG